MKGTIRSIPQDKNFGFIKGENKGDYFFHQEDFHGHWTDLVYDFNNQEINTIEVKFDIVDSLKGPRAGNVSRLDFPNQAEFEGA